MVKHERQKKNLIYLQTTTDTEEFVRSARAMPLSICSHILRYCFSWLQYFVFDAPFFADSSFLFFFCRVGIWVSGMWWCSVLAIVLLHTPQVPQQTSNYMIIAFMYARMFLSWNYNLIRLCKHATSTYYMRRMGSLPPAITNRIGHPIQIFVYDLCSVYSTADTQCSSFECWHCGQAVFVHERNGRTKAKQKNAHSAEQTDANNHWQALILHTIIIIIIIRRMYCNTYIIPTAIECECKKTARLA